MNNAGRALGVVAIAFALAGCGGTLPRNAGSQNTPFVRPGVPLPGASLGKKSLLYVSSIDYCRIFVYTYPHVKLVQTFDVCNFGYGPAFGMCTDTGGDVFMAMGEGFFILRFAHGGTEPIAQLDNGSHQPFGCAVDPKSGKLGVAGGAGYVTVFNNASGKPKRYFLSNIFAFYYCTFDDRGNLFVAGQHIGGRFAFAELPNGGSTLREITVKGIVFPGFAVQWDGRHVALGVTQGINEFGINRLEFHGAVAKVVGTTRLKGPPDALLPFQFWIDGGTVIKPENANNQIGIWKYPGGGDQTKELQPDGFSMIDVTVSSAPPG